MPVTFNFCRIFCLALYLFATVSIMQTSDAASGQARSAAKAKSAAVAERRSTARTNNILKSTISSTRPLAKKSARPLVMPGSTRKRESSLQSRPQRIIKNRQPKPKASKPSTINLIKTNPMMRGVCYASWQTPYAFLTEASDKQLHRLRAAGANYVALRVPWSQEGYDTTDIQPNFATPTDDAIAHVVRVCRANGMKVMLTLLVDFADEQRGGSFRWWGEISPHDQELVLEDEKYQAAWREWFASYTKFVLHYARLSASAGVDVLCLGTELISATPHESEWRKLIAAVRPIYKGALTYQAHSKDEYRTLKFWDALDYVGISGYYPLTATLNPTLDELEVALQKVQADLSQWQQQIKKPILFTEVGFHSADGTASHPWERGALKSLPNPDLQARCYEAFLRTFAERDYVKGIFWWLECPPGEAGVDERGAGHLFLGKPAEKVLRKFWPLH
jgi:hypothetical protein